jgi:hypothetical protein
MPANHFVYFEFPHRMNKNGTIDSICPRCFTTIGCSTWEADLDRMEAAHVCEPSRLSTFSQHRRMPVVPARISVSDDMTERADLPVRSTWSSRSTSSRRSA